MFRQKSRFAICVAWFMAVLPATLSAQPTYQTGALLGIERKVKITPMTYVFDVVATYHETVTYELQIQLGKETYFTD